MAFILTQEGEIRGTHLFALIWLAINCLLLTLTYPVIYIFERIFGYTSEITLIELSNPNHPALRNLTKKAPGTFQHSLMVAIWPRKLFTGSAGILCSPDRCSLSRYR